MKFTSSLRRRLAALVAAVGLAGFVSPVFFALGLWVVLVGIKSFWEKGIHGYFAGAMFFSYSCRAAL